MNSGLMKQPSKMREFKANIASHSTAIAKIFNAEIACFGCWSATHELISDSLKDINHDEFLMHHSHPSHFIYL